jgi:hypothetical protein
LVGISIGTRELQQGKKFREEVKDGVVHAER